MRPGLELVIDAPLTSRATRFLRALAATVPPGVRVVSARSTRVDTIVVYGPGAIARQRYVREHQAQGGRAFFWDMAYWDRVDSLRLAMDGLHPSAAHLAASPDAPRRKFVLRADANSSGPVLLIGLGAKTVAAAGAAPLAWERRKLREIRALWPGRPIAWRPKGKVPVDLEGLPLRHGMPIEQALRGCSAVVCAGSNVAVDACVAGVPVSCEGGAAFALYRDRLDPSPEDRLAFLNKLTWWEWHIGEARAAWAWIVRCNEEIPRCG